MAAKKPTSKNTEKSSAKNKLPQFSIEQLAQKHDVADWIMAGVKQRNKWGLGKELPEQEFLEKLYEFIDGPMLKK